MPEPTLNKEQWLAERQKSIGASEVATVLGLNPFDTPLQLALRKLGQIPNKEQTEAMRIGHDLEDYIASRYQEESGRTVDDPGDFDIVRNPRYPYIHATRDRVAWSSVSNSEGVVELKNVGARLTHHWDDGIPLYVQAQIQAQLLASGSTAWGSAAALLAGTRFVWADVERNDKFIEYMQVRVEAFWMRIHRGDLPKAGETDTDALRLLYPMVTEGKVLQLPSDAMALDAAIIEADAEAAKAEKKRTALRNQLAQLMGDAETGELPDGTRWTHRVSHIKELKPREYDRHSYIRKSV